MTGDHLTGLRACSAKVLPSGKLLYCLVRALLFLLILALLYAKYNSETYKMKHAHLGSATQNAHSKVLAKTMRRQ